MHFKHTIFDLLFLYCHTEIVCDFRIRLRGLCTISDESRGQLQFAYYLSYIVCNIRISVSQIIVQQKKVC